MTPGFKTFTVIGSNLRIYPTKLSRLKDCNKLMCGKLNIFLKENELLNIKMKKVQ